ncbi:MAG: LysM peptidoglycan-binding domain-containing protein [Actinomycetota bacterium]|nr:LysM peptidoglycan-binding domain-containing protein [Actinomycetota bacterium]
MAIAAIGALGMSASSHLVQPGDTLSAIAAANGLTVADLADRNGIGDPNLIRVGQLLQLGAGGGSAGSATGGAYEVRSGDSLSVIAARAGVSTAALASANGITDHDRIYVGARLTIPAAGAGIGASTASVSRSHVVSSGDTLGAIAARYGSSVSAIAAANGISNPNLVRPGVRLTIPSGPSQVAAASALLPDRIRNNPERLQLISVFDRWAAANGVPADLLKSIAWIESGWQNRVTSYVGAQGVGQLMPDTVTFMRELIGNSSLDPRVPEDNIRMMARYVRWLLDRADGDVVLALAGYYQGPTSVDRNGIYSGTDNYAQGVLAWRYRFR